jgi:hypothetical protein
VLYLGLDNSTFVDFGRSQNTPSSDAKERGILTAGLSASLKSRMTCRGRRPVLDWLSVFSSLSRAR